MTRFMLWVFFLGSAVVFSNNNLVAKTTDPLPSWNNGAARQAIIAFVQTTTDKSRPKFVPPEQRIVTFDKDGTL